LAFFHLNEARPALRARLPASDFTSRFGSRIATKVGGLWFPYGKHGNIAFRETVG
jgi:hypothetical protein